ncbi:MAG: hypothetical protein JWN70_1446 [Planctomycetaceae bacterium]|nr:hypothetical protein [Planctomycetaceae bacterium]
MELSKISFVTCRRKLRQQTQSSAAVIENGRVRARCRCQNNRSGESLSSPRLRRNPPNGTRRFPSPSPGHHAKQLILFVVAVTLSVSLIGCGREELPNSVPAAPVLLRPMPPEYLVLARWVAYEFKSSPEEFRDPSPAETASALESGVKALEGIQTPNAEIADLAAQAVVVYRDIRLHFQQIQTLPRPRGYARQCANAFLGGLYSGYSGDLSGLAYVAQSSFDAQSKLQAIMDELNELWSAVDRLEAIQAQLPRVALKYSAPRSTSDNRLDVDMDAAWGPPASHDWLKLFNAGPGDLENCTVQVELTGGNGKSRKNVHFIGHWPAASWVCTKYSHGEPMADRADAGRQTLGDLQHAEVSIWSAGFTTNQTYVYLGAERDKDVASLCHSMTTDGRYRPFVKGMLWHTQRSVEFTLGGIDSLPGFQADVKFCRDTTSKVWSSQHPGWKKGEKKAFTPPKDVLTFDPSHIELVLSFPGTKYQYNSTMIVK